MGYKYRTILVAVVVTGYNEKDRQNQIFGALQGIEKTTEAIDSWWIAEDERYDGTGPEYDSAIFVPFGSQPESRSLITKE